MICSRFRVPMMAWVIVAAFSPSPVTAQEEASSEKAYSKVPRAIAFQNDSQWEDNRWQQTEIGPFLAATVRHGDQTTLKGLVIRVGSGRDAAVCFDTARMRYSAGWTGGYLNFGSRRFGLLDWPAAAGPALFQTGRLAGWANDTRFRPAIDEITDPETDRSYGKEGSSVTCLPSEWAQYRGHYTHGQRVILSYTVGETEVLESPWHVAIDGHHAFTRSLMIGATRQPRQLLISDSPCSVRVLGSDAVELIQRGDNQILEIPPHDRPLTFKLLIAAEESDETTLDRLADAAGPMENLGEMIQSDEGRYRQVLTTRGETTDGDGPYVIDTLTLPFENPWNALLFTAGHDFFSDGRAAICTVHGDVWVVDGVDRTLERLSWRRFATGLHQPLGLKIVEDQVYVICRNQITRLHDRNVDGEADFYESFNNQIIVAPRSHDYVTCLETDPQGNFYFIHAKTGVMKVAADGSSLTQVADGFRNPNGMGVSPTGMITAAPQQGTWTPESSLIVVQPGGYYGYGGPRVTPDRPTGWDLPMCFIPRAMDNSGGGQVWVQGDQWGLEPNTMLHLSYGQCRLLLALTEQVDDTFQGGTIEFPTTPQDFQSGVMRGRFNPHDGQLYVSGLRGWQTRAIRDGCFQRVRYTGHPVNLPVSVKTFSNGIQLTFQTPLDRDFAQRPENYFAKQWNYAWTAAYGSPDYSVLHPKQQGRDEVTVVSATLLDDDKTLFLEMPDRQPVHQLQVGWQTRSRSGDVFRGQYAHTINAPPTEAFPESQIVRREIPRFVDEATEKRLRPGVVFHFRSRENRQSDSVVKRLITLRQPVDQSSTPFLPPGPFDVEVAAALSVPLSGQYQFRVRGDGDALTLRVNDQVVLDRQGDLQTDGHVSSPVLLVKGYNRVELAYSNATNEPAVFGLEWKGADFQWEPVPSASLFHDPSNPVLQRANQLRDGRELFASRHCNACHRTSGVEHAMFELSLAAPDLSAAGANRDAEWLRQWILSPTHFRPGTAMPAVLGVGPEAERDAADITAFLMDAATERAASPSPKGDAQIGERIYEQQSCLTCHHFQPPGHDDPYDRLSLHYVSQKFPAGALASFLMDPTRHHAGVRMPDFGFDPAESASLEAYLRDQASGKLNTDGVLGDAVRGRVLFVDRGCVQCHLLEKHQNDLLADRVAVMPPAAKAELGRGCLAEKSVGRDSKATIPNYSLTSNERKALQAFLQTDRSSLTRSVESEASQRLFVRLQCIKCHDRDGVQSQRRLVVAEEGSGNLPEAIPQLDWSGEKLTADWLERQFAGQLSYKSRPWLQARMPAFPAYSAALAHGFAAEHGVAAGDHESVPLDPDRVRIGEELTRQTGLDCRQCHAIGDQQPRGDEKTAIALGINFVHIGDRMRPEAYRRFIMDPPRYDVTTRMIKLSADGLTTHLKHYFDGDAKQQFDAIWQYIESLPEPSPNPGPEAKQSDE